MLYTTFGDKQRGVIPEITVVDGFIIVFWRRNGRYNGWSILPCYTQIANVYRRKFKMEKPVSIIILLAILIYSCLAAILRWKTTDGYTPQPKNYGWTDLFVWRIQGPLDEGQIASFRDCLCVGIPLIKELEHNTY